MGKESLAFVRDMGWVWGSEWSFPRCDSAGVWGWGDMSVNQAGLARQDRVSSAQNANEGNSYVHRACVLGQT